MVFLGSEKYPGENEYKRYLSQHGGRSNASTSIHSTTYKFEVLAKHAEHVIDVFSNFFIAPLFTESGTGREVNAVDSENSKNLVADIRRRLQIIKSIGDPKHYFTKFTTGNSKTLPTNNDEQIQYIRSALLAFHAKHYNPSRLTVVVVGPQPLDTLEKWIVPRFASMKESSATIVDVNSNNHDLQKLIDDAAQEVLPYTYQAPAHSFVSPFRPELQRYLMDNNHLDAKIPNEEHQPNASLDSPWPIQLTLKPVRSMRKLVLLFPLPPTYKTPDSNPISMLSHLLGHEGPHSPFAVLQNDGLLSSLSSSTRFNGPDFSIFNVEINLTERGEENYKLVIDIILQHCQLILSTAQRALQEKKEQIAETPFESESAYASLQRIWDETVQLQTIFFNQTSPGSAYDLAPSLSEHIVHYGTENAISAGRMLNQTASSFPLEQLADSASMLIPSNMIVERCSQNAFDDMEKLFDSALDKPTEDRKIVKIGDDVVIERKKEPWYDIEFFLSKISSKDVSRWKSLNKDDHFIDVSHLLQLPGPNRYIPRSLELCLELPEEAKKGPRIDKEIDPPNLIINDESAGRLWHRLDDRYALPKSALMFLLRNTATQHMEITESHLDAAKLETQEFNYDTMASVHSSLVASIFAEAMAQETYDASLAGLHWELSLGASGIRINCSGFSDRLPDLFLKVFEAFLNGTFIEQSYFVSAKDKLLRNLKTYFESRRADAHAQYYRDFVLSSKDFGIDETIRAVESVTLETLKEHHKKLIGNTDMSIDCLFSGNVSEKDAKQLFKNASHLIHNVNPDFSKRKDLDKYHPGSVTRRLSPCWNDVELHFASKNPQEENGACLVTFQSSVPGFRGSSLSSPESLRSSASIRLLSHMLREPLFTELRTKQTLGYIVSSYHDLGFSSVRWTSDEINDVQQSIPVDSIVIYVLSKKLSPPEIASRIDEFLISFRESLLKMPDSEIQHHATALSTQLTKPIQKLGTESTIQFSKIRRYASEVLTGTDDSHRNTDQLLSGMPWDSAKALASAIEKLQRDDLIQTLEQLTNPVSRNRIVSCVYGTTFPIEKNMNDFASLKSTTKNNCVTLNSLDDALNFRKQLSIYDKSMIEPMRRRSFSSTLMQFKAAPGYLIPQFIKSAALYQKPPVLGIAAVFGFGFLAAAAGWSLFSSRNKKNH